MKRIREGLIRFCGREFLVCMEHGGRVVSADAPVPTITTARGGAIGFVEPFIINYNGNGGARSISEPLPTVTTRDRFALITPEITQVGFRMLTPGELAAAQSFPHEYRFTGTREETVKQIGNAVCPKIAEALTSGYMGELAGCCA
jgi:DNA (cytosine-5)-methyltransferase 1